jgi:hypothetical protein
MTRTRSEARRYALGCILTDGLNYSWFEVIELDDEAVTATLRVDTGERDERDRPIRTTVHITADDIARGLRLYEEVLSGRREGFPGEWRYRAKDAVREGLIGDVSEFVGTEHAVAPKSAYAWQTIEFGKSNGARGDYDANTADSVMQLATLGEVMYG